MLITFFAHFLTESKMHLIFNQLEIFELQMSNNFRKSVVFNFRPTLHPISDRSSENQAFNITVCQCTDVSVPEVYQNQADRYNKAQQYLYNAF